MRGFDGLTGKTGLVDQSNKLIATNREVKLSFFYTRLGNGSCTLVALASEACVSTRGVVTSHFPPFF